MQDHRHHGHEHHDHDHGHVVAGPPAANALISGRGLTLVAGKRELVQDVDIDIAPAEIVTLIGPNGAGKTTLVKLLLGLVAPTRGTIVRRAGLTVGYVPQRFDVERTIPITVDRFLALGRPADEATRAAALAEVGAATLARSQIAELSGGELQRVLLARALQARPHLIVLDEPVRGVDYQGEAELYALISRLRDERGVGVLLVSHDLHVVMASSDRVICINGHICCSGRPRSVAQHPEYARLFGPQAVRSLALYEHAHDHFHDLAGMPQPAASAPTTPKGPA
jgi:zinc transport system ATP-binding protein